MNIFNAIKYIESNITDPTKGLPEEVFLFITRHTPMVNIDLLIKDENGRTLLSWRNDPPPHKPGWHIPGGIIRYKETFEQRIKNTAKNEIGIENLEYELNPIDFNEIIIKQKNRGHFLSFLFKVNLNSSFQIRNCGLNENDSGFLKWHVECPDNLIKIHQIYEKFINNK